MNCHITCQNPSFSSMVGIVREMLISPSHDEGVPGWCRLASPKGNPKPAAAWAFRRNFWIAVLEAGTRRAGAPA